MLKKRQLICFDIDGTLLTDKMENEGQYVKGIIPESELRRLQTLGFDIAIVSPSPFNPNGFPVFAEYGSNEYRWKNVDDAISYYRQNRFNTIYVDDLQANRNQLEKIDVISYTPEHFMELFTNITD